MLSPHETFTKATHLILFLRTEDWLSRFYAARVIRYRPIRPQRSPMPVVAPIADIQSQRSEMTLSAKRGREQTQQQMQLLDHLVDDGQHA
jgi:hypothetical protein